MRYYKNWCVPSPFPVEGQLNANDVYKKYEFLHLCWKKPVYYSIMNLCNFYISIKIRLFVLITRTWPNTVILKSLLRLRTFQALASVYNLYCWIRYSEVQYLLMSSVFHNFLNHHSLGLSIRRVAIEKITKNSESISISVEVYYHSDSMIIAQVKYQSRNSVHLDKTLNYITLNILITRMIILLQLVQYSERHVPKKIKLNEKCRDTINWNEDIIH